MLHSNVKGASINSQHCYDVSKKGCRKSFLEVLNHQLCIPNRQNRCKTKLRSCRYDQTLKPRNFVNKSDNFIILERKRLRERRNVKMTSLPLSLELGYSRNDDKFSSFFDRMSKLFNAFYRFTRPHTIIGTLIGVTSIFLLPIRSTSDLSPQFFMAWLKTLLPTILMNIYVVGLNQLFDVEIDKVNKPDLPLASGEFTMGVGLIIVLICCISSFAMGFASHSPPLIMALIICFSLGSAYSLDLPFLRWKKHPFLAASSIVIVRAMTLQLAFFIHVQKYVLGRAITLTRPLMFATSFMCFFVTVIALFKDIPDIDGDKHFGIQSFSIKLGKEKVFWLCVKMLLVAYGSAVALGATSAISPNNIIMMVGHSTLASILWIRAQSVDLTDNVSITSFYMFIWKLFYSEYFLLPFVR
ncbi:hypothetical protein RND81_10G148700 [Saponaria officinalis]|uniref:Uncharacterized protein n=1 Tax=Saponaria officinalis TaxID=3572 RepID=A0AAW1I254_SAPOF